ncbi:CRISPR-associated protein Csx20 [Desulfobacter sp.]|uniref:CRISPR-associated protein Csx20 n=1 Tax=Desulfobacter sp. TaxID=2294 RepID=UPI003D129319
MFNHSLSKDQEADAQNIWGRQLHFVGLPAQLKALWSQIPADRKCLFDTLTPFRTWLEKESCPSDVVLIQGDFGATWLMVQHALNNSLVPVYSVTVRQAREEMAPDGTVKNTHFFKHRMFRVYGI